MKLKERDLLVAGGLFLLWRWWHSETDISLPDGAHIPMTGDPHEVPRGSPTRLDPHGLPDLFNSALQYADQLIHLGPEHSPPTLPPDEDYDLAARIFAMQCALETDDGRSLYHFNTGNLTTEQGDYFLNPPSRHHYAVFLYPMQGALAQVDRVKRLWPDAYRAAYSGSVTGFVKALKPPNAPQYFEADATKYRDGMLARGRRFGWDAGIAGPGVRKRRLAPSGRRA